MKFRTIYTKNKKEYIYNIAEVRDLFEINNNCFQDCYILKSEFDTFYSECETEEEKRYFYDYWHTYPHEIIEDKKEYFKEVIEYEKWTSPKGVEPVYKVIEILND